MSVSLKGIVLALTFGIWISGYVLFNMYSTSALRSAEIPLFKHGKYLNKDTWGNLGSQPQKGIISYSLSPNKQRINYSFSSSNAWRRFRTQVLYWAPPMIAAYCILQYMEEKNRFLNSKEGRKLRKNEA